MDDESNASFGLRLQRTREKQGMTVASLAAACRISDSAVASIENGRTRHVPFLTGVKLAYALDVEPWWLATGTDEPQAERITRLETRVTRLESVLQWLSKAVSPGGAPR